MTESTITPEGFTVSRVFDATPEQVWQAWTTPEQFATWFGTEAIEVPLDTVTMDVRPGGDLRATMILPDGTRLEWNGRYREVEPPARLVYVLSDDPDDDIDAGEPVETLFAPVDGGTRVTIFQPRYGFSDEQIEATIAGYSGFYDSLGRVLGE